MTFTSVSFFSDCMTSSLVVGTVSLGVGCIPSLVDPRRALDHARMTRPPAQALLRLFCRDEFVLVEPGADIVALLGTLEADLLAGARGRDAGTHHLGGGGTEIVGEMEDLTGDICSRPFRHQPIGFRKIRNMD